jgi:hypothetical protein
MTDSAGTLVFARGVDGPAQLDLFGTPGCAPSSSPSPDAEPSELTLSRIGHDLRTALNAIIGFSEVMAHRLHGPLGHPKYEEYADGMRMSGQAMLAVSDRVLVLAAQRVFAPDRVPATHPGYLSYQV